MDKSWMFANRKSQKYEKGVRDFLKFAVDNLENPDFIPCPCIKCCSIYNMSTNKIRDHLFEHGIDPTYKEWVWHGEDLLDEVEPNVTTDYVVDDDYEMESLDIDENIIKLAQAAQENFSENPKRLCKLLQDANKPLYNSCKRFTKLSALVNLFNLKAKGGWSDKSFMMLIKLLKVMLPSNNELPSTMNEVKQTLSTFGMEYQKIHACPNDCILYMNEYEREEICPTCDTSRYKKSRGTTTKKSKAPAKVLWYFSPIPRFRKMYQSAITANNLRWHADGRKVIDGQLRHPADSPAWKHVDNMWPEFAADTRNLRLALSADGINPHRSLSSRNSCWPVMLITYNLPPWLCMKRKFLMLTMLISGPRQPSNDIDVYLRPLIEDLKTLWGPGVEVYDAYKQESFTLKAILMWTISDFPAFGNLAGCVVKGYLACPTCAEETDSIRLIHSKKNCYMAHRRLLPTNHRFRKLRKAFNGEKELRASPIPLSGEQVYDKVKGIKVSWGKKIIRIDKLKGLKRKRIGKEKIVDANKNDGYWKKKSIFFELEYWKHLLVRHNLDVMHIEKNVCDNIIGTLLNIPGKTKDGLKCRKDLQEMHLKVDLAPEVRGSRTYLPPACYTLTKEEKTRLCRTLFELKVPDGYCSNLRSLVSMDDLKLYGLKSHDNHILMQHILPVAIRSVLPKHVRYSIIRLCFFFNDLCTKVVDVSRLEDIQKDLVVTLCLLEMYFPPSFFDIMVYLTVHLVREVELCGPVFFRWMFPFERFMMVLKSYVRNRSRPEGCIAENYISEEAIEFCTEYLIELELVGLPPSRNMTPYDEDTGKTISDGKPLGGCIVLEVDRLSLEQAHQCVLVNANDVQPYIMMHNKILKRRYSGKTAKWILDEHNRTFINWFRTRVEDEENAKLEVSEIVKVVAQGPRPVVLKYPGYVINGYRFHTKSRDASLVTQNCGVSIVASAMQFSSSKDKNPIISPMGFYGVITEIWLLDYFTLKIPVFKCDWVENNKGIKVDDLGFTSVQLERLGHKSDPFILASQAKQVFYVTDQLDPKWSIVLVTPQRDYQYEDEDELLDGCVEDHIFNKAPPEVNIEETPSSYTRADGEGIWIDHMPVSN